MNSTNTQQVHELDPPKALEDRVVRALHAESLLYPHTPRETSMKKIHVAWAAAAAVLLVAGLAFGRYMPATTGASDARPQFVLFLYEDSKYDPIKPGEDRVAEYTAWAHKLGERGYLVDGAKLEEDGVFLSPISTAPQSASPDIAMLAGYFIIRAADRDEAQRIARECPHLAHGGTISLRQIDS